MSKVSFLLVPACVLLFSLHGCASTYEQESTWRRATGSGGFSETRLGENVFSVSFAGNPMTGGDRTSDFAMLRAAELTLDNGFSFFAVITEESAQRLASYSTPAQTHTTWQPTGDYGAMVPHTTTVPGTMHLQSSPETKIRIECFKQRPSGDGLIYDASFVRSSIRAKYHL
jgi:hypothetical protein